MTEKMKKGRTIVEIDLEPEAEEAEKSSSNDLGDKNRYYLLHWGLECNVVNGNNPGEIIPVTYTVGICQNISTGQIETFPPRQIRVLGDELLNEKEN
jgi:hypothetical protein